MWWWWWWWWWYVFFYVTFCHKNERKKWWAKANSSRDRFTENINKFDLIWFDRHTLTICINRIVIKLFSEKMLGKSRWNFGQQRVKVCLSRNKKQKRVVSSVDMSVYIRLLMSAVTLCFWRSNLWRKENWKSREREDVNSQGTGTCLLYTSPSPRD